MVENNNDFNGNFGVPPYGVPPYGPPGNDFSQIYFERERRKSAEKKEIRVLGTLTGAAILLVFLAQNLITSILSITGLYSSYINNSFFQMGFDMLITVVSILVPFLIFGIIMKNKSGCTELVPLEKPTNKKLALLAVPAGLGLCMAANIVTSYLVVFLKIFGIELFSPEIANPSGIFGFIVSVLRVSVIAALVEEISFRGCAMQPLRKYGDGFAIVMSACAFGLMHCNLIQAPFALIVGLGLGYISTKTGTLWIAVIVHALNNFISSCFSYMLDSNMSEERVNVIYSFTVYFILIFGLICFMIFAKKSKQSFPLYRGSGILTAGQKVGTYILNPTMIIAIIIVIYYTAHYVKF